MKHRGICAAALLMCLALLFSAVPACADSLPDAFTVTYKADERLINNKRGFVSKEHITTANAAVSEEINALVDAYDDQYAPVLKTSDNPKRNSRLDIHVVHTVTGTKWVSFLVLARQSYKREQLCSPFTTRAYDMDTGAQLAITDVVQDTDAAWEILGSAVREQLSAYFPDEEADAETLDRLCSKEGLLQTPFMLTPTSLTLHYAASELYPNHPTLMHVTIYYQALADVLTDEARVQTDNSAYSLVALTFDDGPGYTNTARLLNNLRRTGAVATFFLVGSRIDEYMDIARRENDENHSLQSHHYVHTNAEKSSTERIQSYSEKVYKKITEIAGKPPIMMRPPYGLYEPYQKANVNLPIIMWSVDTKDWTGKSASAILSTVKKNVAPGAIILMHDIKDNTAEAAKLTAEYLHKQGYLCVTVEDLFAYYGTELEPNHHYSHADQQ